jgi:hypothetical protein
MSTFCATLRPGAQAVSCSLGELLWAVGDGPSVATHEHGEGRGGMLARHPACPQAQCPRCVLALQSSPWGCTGAPLAL